jgi:hypothetical protein
MKNFIISMVLVLNASSLYAANAIQPYESAVGAEVIARQVLSKKILGKNHPMAQYLRYALEGSGLASEHVVMSQMKCDRAAGVDTCSVMFVIENTKDKDDEGFSFELEVRQREGNISFAEIINFIG